MISITLIAGILLVFRLVSVFLIAQVIRRQWGLLKLPVPAEYRNDEKSIKKLRKILFFLSIAIFVGNAILAFIDALTLFVETGRPSNLRAVSVAYAAFSNATTALVSAILVWLLYFGVYVNSDAPKVRKSK